MLVHPAEESFQKGMDLLAEEHTLEALAYFSAALEIERRISDDRPQARYLSYYGLCLALTGGDRHEATRCCRMATQFENYRPEMAWNLGRVLLKAGRRREAHKTLRRGLRIQPGHQGIIRDLKRMGLRRKPILPFLSRDNPANVFLGRLLFPGARRNGAKSNGRRLAAAR